MLNYNKWLKYGLVLSTGLVLAACGNGNDNAQDEAGNSEEPTETAEESTDDSTVEESTEDEDPVKLKVGVVGEVENEIWTDIADRLEDENIDLSVEVFSDYVQPNQALAQGDIDLNAFQHIAFLNEYLESSGEDIVPIGYTYISPLSAYSEEIESLDEIANSDEQATITIPNDPTNGGRALLLLQLAGLIEVDEAAGITPSTEDITDNPHNINIEPIDASQVPRTIGDATAVVANAGIAVDAGLSPEDDSIFSDTDDLSKAPAEYKNVIAVREEDETDENILKVVEEFQSPETKEISDKASNGTNEIAYTDDDDVKKDFEESQNK